MYIDGDTHYWPVRFLERVDHPGRGHIEFTKGGGEMVRYEERFPDGAATYYRDGKKILQRNALEFRQAPRGHAARRLRLSGGDRRGLFGMKG